MVRATIETMNGWKREAQLIFRLGLPANQSEERRRQSNHRRPEVFWESSTGRLKNNWVLAED